MARNLDFKALDQTIESNDKLVSNRNKRWKRREANPTVQMSVRMHEDNYERFRALCELERRTNGEMMEVLMEHYIKTHSSEES